jgi:hypothetical protein
MNKICKYCGIEFETIYKIKIFCSNKCNNKHKWLKRDKKEHSDYINKLYHKKMDEIRAKRDYRICSVCGKKFKPYRSDKKYWKNIIENNSYSHIRFKNGYNNKCSEILIEYNGYEKRMIRHEFFGSNEVEVYVLKLGKIISSTIIKKNVDNMELNFN